MKLLSECEFMHRRASLPARINILGEHTDYAGGLALPFATHLRLTLNAFSQDEGYEGDPTVIDLWRAAGGWPARLTVDSQIPIGVGMSSSAALCLAVVLCVNGSMKPLEACLEAQRIEHQVLKTPCGLLDQMAMMFAKEGCATLIDFSNQSTQSVALPPEWMFKLVDSGIHRNLVETSYRGIVDDAIQITHVETENQTMSYPPPSAVCAAAHLSVPLAQDSGVIITSAPNASAATLIRSSSVATTTRSIPVTSLAARQDRSINERDWPDAPLSIANGFAG